VTALSLLNALNSLTLPAKPLIIPSVRNAQTKGIKMSDSSVVTPPENSPPQSSELFPTPPPQNEPDPEIQTPAENSVIEKLKSVSAGVFERAGVQFKRGRGRPRLDGNPGKGDLPLNAPATALPAVAACDPPLAPRENLDPALVRRCCSAVLKSLTGILDKALFRKAVKKTGDSKFAQQLITDTTVTQEEISAFSELAEICLRKYGVGTEYAPEIGIGVILAGLGVRYGEGFKSLDAYEDGKGAK
jgi:hypothetical protein